MDYNNTSFSNKVFYPHEIAVKHIENKKRNRGIKFISEEKTNDEISSTLYISKRTVDSHHQNLLNKLQVKNTTGLTKIAIQLKLV
ncbi:MAG: response regulator transcription factor [Ferruginibacter sp.]|nr:response regulator transcription factor [Ferruginibacter sp.]